MLIDTSFEKHSTLQKETEKTLKKNGDRYDTITLNNKSNPLRKGFLAVLGISRVLWSVLSLTFEKLSLTSPLPEKKLFVELLIVRGMGG